MPKKKSDKRSVEYTRAVLEKIGCPQARRAEGTPEWKAVMRDHTLTPDLVAGPIVGGGDPSDFYIDVFEPSGEQFVDPDARNPQAAAVFLKALLEHGPMRVGDLGANFEHFYGPMNKKIAKYAGRRSNSPMLGLAMYFRMLGNQFVGPILAALHALGALDCGFSITPHLGPNAMDQVIRTVLGPGGRATILSLPIQQPLSLVLYIAEKNDGPVVIPIINREVRNPDHPYAAHPVTEWLRKLATPSQRAA